MVTALPNAYFGAGNGSVNAYNFGCTGAETNISSCPFQFADPNNACDHSDDASVLCGTILSKLNEQKKHCVRWYIIKPVRVIMLLPFIVAYSLS